MVPTDVRDAEQCEALVERTTAERGGIDILVNNAGGSWSLPFEQWTLDKWQNMIDLNLRSVFVLSVAASKSMLDRGGGAMVNISSKKGAGRARVAVCRALRCGEGRREQPHQDVPRFLDSARIRVNCIAVGPVASEGFIRAMERIGQKYDKVGGAANAVGRAGRPEEIANGILFLVSDAASFVSGETIYFGGGPKVAVPLA